MATYRANQIPDYVENDYVTWTTDDYRIWIEREPGKRYLKDEKLIWNEAEEEWESEPISREEAWDVAKEEEFVLPTDQGIFLLTDLFKRSTGR